MRWELVGRETELARLRDHLSTSPITVLHGDAGVGKSRLLAEALRRHARGGHAVFHTLATAATQDVPLSPFVGLLASPPPTDPALLMATLAGAAQARGGTEGLVIAIDDAHHLDATSVGFLAVATAGSRTRIVMTVRDDAALLPGLEDLLRHDMVTRVGVEPLSRHDTGALATAMAHDLPSAVEDDVWRLTQGNPLMVRELLADGTFISATSARAEQTPSRPALARLRDLARQRLAAFPADLSDAMELLAVGAPVPSSVLEHATSTHVVDLLLAKHAAQVESHGDAEVLMPAHPLYGAVLRDGIDAPRRRELCHRLMTAAAGSGAQVDPLRAALWQHEAAREIDPAVARAGVEAALSRYDGALAQRLLQPVLDRLEGPQAALLGGMAFMQQRLFGEAESAFAAIDPTNLPPGPAGDLCSARAFNLAFGLQDPATADDVLRVGQERATGSPIAARLQSERGVIAALGGDLEPAVAAARHTLELPQADEATLTSAYVSLTVAEAMRGRCASMVEHVESGLAHAERAGPAMPFARDQLEITRTQALLFGGRCTDARDRCSTALSDPARSQMHWLWNVFLAVIECTRGRADAALEASAHALAQRASAALLDLEGAVLCADAMARAASGDGRDVHGIEEMAATRADVRNLHWIDRGRVWLAAARGETDAAARLAFEAGQRTLERQHRSWGIEAMHDAVRLWMPGRAGDAVDMDDVAGAMHVALDGTSAVALLETMVAHASAVALRDPEHLERVALQFYESGARLYAVEAQAQAAALLGDAGDARAAARAVLRSVAWERECDGISTPAIASRPGPGVSQRVLDIALAAAHGQSSAALAQEMFLSVRTVDNHLGSAYRAFDVAGRHELASLIALTARPDRVHP